MTIETTRKTNEQTGKAESITVKWLEKKGSHGRLQKAGRLLLKISVLSVLGFVIAAAFISLIEAETGNAFTILVIVFVSSLFFIAILFKGFRAKADEWRSLTIHADGSLYAAHGLPDDKFPVRKNIVRAWSVFFFIASAVMVTAKEDLNDVSYTTAVGVFVLLALFVMLVIFIYIWRKGFWGAKGIHKGRLLSITASDIANFSLDDFSQWGKASDTRNGAYQDVQLVVMMKRNGEPVFLSYSHLYKADLLPVITALTNAFEEILPRGKTRKRPHDN